MTARTKTIPDLARAASDAIEMAAQGARDAAEHVRRRRFAQADGAAATLAADRDTGADLCEALAARLTSHEAAEVRAIGKACRLGYARPEMGLTLLRIAAHADAAERDTDPGEEASDG